MDLCSENFMQVTDLLFLLKLMKEALRLLFRARRFLSYDVTSHCSSFSDCRSCVPWLKRMRIGQEFKSLYCVCRVVLFRASTCILWPWGTSAMSGRSVMWELLQSSGFMTKESPTHQVRHWLCGCFWNWSSVPFYWTVWSWSNLHYFCIPTRLRHLLFLGLYYDRTFASVQSGVIQGWFLTFWDLMSSCTCLCVQNTWHFSCLTS